MKYIHCAQRLVDHSFYMSCVMEIFIGYVSQNTLHACKLQHVI